MTERFQFFAYGGGIEAGIKEFTKIIRGGDDVDNARFALGALHFLRALEGLQHDLYRYGAGNVTFEGPLKGLIPVFRVPTFPNDNAEIITYEKTREMLSDFVFRLTQAEDVLSLVGNSDIKLPLNLARITLDINQNGKADTGEALLATLSSMGGPSGGMSLATSDALTAFLIHFDTADAKWLQGYSNLLMAFAKTFLSMDYRSSYDVSFHTIFGREATSFGRKLSAIEASLPEITKLEAALAALEKKQSEVFSSEERARLGTIKRERRQVLRDASLSESQKESALALTSKEFEQLTKKEHL